ncbi:MAG: flagellar export protein FliJ [Planctomycetota bacterium]
MPKFRFALQRVLDRRLDEEEAKRAALGRIEAERRRLEDALRDRQREISSGRDEWRAGLVGAVDPASLRHHAASGVGMMRRAQRTVLELAGLQKGLEKARVELVEAARARRALEILRERRLAAHLADESRRESADLEEIALGFTRRDAVANDIHQEIAT